MSHCYWEENGIEEQQWGSEGGGQGSRGGSGKPGGRRGYRGTVSEINSTGLLTPGPQQTITGYRLQLIDDSISDPSASPWRRGLVDISLGFQCQCASRVRDFVLSVTLVHSGTLSSLIENHLLQQVVHGWAFGLMAPLQNATLDQTQGSVFCTQEWCRSETLNSRPLRSHFRVRPSRWGLGWRWQKLYRVQRRYVGALLK